MEEKDNFDKYVVEWFHGYIEDHKDDEDLFMSLFNAICPLKEGETVSDWIGEGTTVKDWLLNCSGYEIYEHLFSVNNDGYFKDLPDSEYFVSTMLTEASKETGLLEYEFVNEIIGDMACHITGYDSPISFFDDLQHGGCISGMIGKFVYNSDCKEFFSKYAVSMEDFRDDLEDEYWDAVKRHRNLPHYVWLCWLCYEEVAFRLARYLFENHF